MPAGRKRPKGGGKKLAVHPTPPLPAGQVKKAGSAKRQREGGACGGPGAANGASPGLSRGFAEAARKKLRGEAAQIALRRGSAITLKSIPPPPAPSQRYPAPTITPKPHCPAPHPPGSKDLHGERKGARGRKKKRQGLSGEEEGGLGGGAVFSGPAEGGKKKRKKKKGKGRKVDEQGGGMVEDVAIHVRGATPQGPLASDPSAASAEGASGSGSDGEREDPVPPPRVVVVTEASQLPPRFLEPPDCGANPEEPALVVGFDCEGISLSRYGRLCVLQVSNCSTLERARIS